MQLQEGTPNKAHENGPDLELQQMLTGLGAEE